MHDSRQPLNHDVTIGNVQKLARVSLRYGQKFLTDRGENESRLVGDQLASRYRELHPECFLASPLGVFAGLGLLDLGCGQPLVEFELRQIAILGYGWNFRLKLHGLVTYRFKIWSETDANSSLTAAWAVCGCPQYLLEKDELASSHESAREIALESLSKS